MLSSLLPHNFLVFQGGVLKLGRLPHVLNNIKSESNREGKNEKLRVATVLICLGHSTVESPVGDD